MILFVRKHHVPSTQVTISDFTVLVLEMLLTGPLLAQSTKIPGHSTIA